MSSFDSNVRHEGAKWWITIYLGNPARSDDRLYCGHHCPQNKNADTIPYCDCFKKVLEKEKRDGFDLTKRLRECITQEMA